VSDQIDNNKLYRVLVFNAKIHSTEDIAKGIEAAMTQGFGPHQFNWSPDGAVLVVTMINGAEATKQLAETLTGALGGGQAAYGGRGGFGLS
jgi:hypothetical protein